MAKSERCRHEKSCGYEFCNGSACAEFKPETSAEMRRRVIQVDGYKAFRGTMRITPRTAVPAYELRCSWLYKPDTGCWYGQGSSFPEDICTIVEVE